jgi:hypothetical protein
MKILSENTVSNTNHGMVIYIKDSLSKHSYHEKFFTKQDPTR